MPKNLKSRTGKVWPIDDENTTETTEAYFQLFVDRFYDSERVKAMEPTQRYLYLALLMAQWKCVILPTDFDLLSETLTELHGEPPMQKIFWINWLRKDFRPPLTDCFIMEKDQMFNERLGNLFQEARDREIESTRSTLKRREGMRQARETQIRNLKESRSNIGEDLKEPRSNRDPKYALTKGNSDPKNQSKKDSPPHPPLKNPLSYKSNSSLERKDLKENTDLFYKIYRSINAKEESIQLAVVGPDGTLHTNALFKKRLWDKWSTKIMDLYYLKDRDDGYGSKENFAQELLREALENARHYAIDHPENHPRTEKGWTQAIRNWAEKQIKFRIASRKKGKRTAEQTAKSRGEFTPGYYAKKEAKPEYELCPICKEQKWEHRDWCTPTLRKKKGVE